MNAITTIPKLDKLIPLLGSDKDGEALAAARAIGRTLKRAGCDWHDVARAIEIAAKAAHNRVDLIEADSELAAAQYCYARRADLKPSEADFIKSILRTLGYGYDLTPKQALWLKAIFVGIGGRQ